MTVDELRKVLVARWPMTFGPPRPLALGVHREIFMALAPPQGTKKRARAALQAFLRDWTQADEYLRALADGGECISLDGQPAGLVSRRHRRHRRHRRAAAGQLKVRRNRKPASDDRSTATGATPAQAPRAAPVVRYKRRRLIPAQVE
ncbi:ProQ/FinO family protein [Burkholderiaceae bacterium FT117]|uniref:ProQ/FINO family protein n=1 Tax=Zeimonas sediminis TaxID=2944268 RepID=UPI0023431C3A|nr:ProQ/FINO family protein [Zeimonas sediminis]MCM5570056.1 ProQ/FinO family protein [Zeimonas sediminis]